MNQCFIHPFAHRANNDGSQYSICRTCSAIIATSVYEADLEAMEAFHVCKGRFESAELDGYLTAKPKMPVSPWHSLSEALQEH